MPVFLWSTVVIQLQNPVVSRGRRKTDRWTGAGAGSSTASAITGLRSGRAISLQRLQIPYQRLDLGIGEHRSAGLAPGPDLHVVAGLHGLGIVEPVGQVLGRVLEDRAGEGRPASEVSEIGTDHPGESLD